MNGDLLVTVVTVLGSVVGGGFAVTLLNRWFDRDKQRTDQAGTVEIRTFADNEQARLWLREQLDESDKELVKVRESERALLKQVGELAAQVARQEERTNAQSARIDDLSTTVARLGADYVEMKAERDQYRDQKHAAENRLTVESTKRQLAERDLVARDEEIARLRGQIAAMTPHPEGPR